MHISRWFFDDEALVHTNDAAKLCDLEPDDLADLRGTPDGPPFVVISTAPRYRIRDLKAWHVAREASGGTSTAVPSDAGRKAR